MKLRYAGPWAGSWQVLNPYPAQRRWRENAVLLNVEAHGSSLEFPVHMVVCV